MYRIYRHTIDLDIDKPQSPSIQQGSSIQTGLYSIVHFCTPRYCKMISKFIILERKKIKKYCNVQYITSTLLPSLHCNS